jgi:hypothetical protein
VAICRARAATRHAGDWLPQQYIASGVRAAAGRVRSGAERGRVYRRPERDYRISLGGRPRGSTAVARGGFGSPSGEGEGGSPSSLAARAATAKIPIVFETAGDPVALGLVASLNRPGGNLTGVTNLNVEVAEKKLELLRELLPSATIIAVLVNPSAPTITEEYLRALQSAAPRLGMQLQVMQASTDLDLNTIFATMRADALLIGPYLFFNSRMETAWRTVAPARGAHYLQLSQVRRSRRPDELRTR